MALAAGAACTKRGDSSGTAGGGGKPTAAASANVRLRLGFVGLCAFVAELTNYKVGLLNATKVLDPGGQNYFYQHDPIILIDSSVASGGTTVSGRDLDNLHLGTEVTSFQKWSLQDRDVAIADLPTRKTIASLPGAVPMRSLVSDTLPADWDKQAWIQATVPLKGGRLMSAIPRQNINGAEKMRWKLTGSTARNSDEWKMIGDLPRLLSDTVEYRTLIPENVKISLTSRKSGTPIDIQTTATTDLEIWILNSPKDHTPYEMAHQWELQHIRAFYQLFGSTTYKVPIADPAGFPGGDPVFCPPAEVS